MAVIDMKTTYTHDPVLVAIVKARPDPRDIKRSLRKTGFIGDKSHYAYQTGRLALARLLYLTREIAMGISQKTFGRLITEDYKRELILGGADYDEVSEIKVISDITLHRIEYIEGERGSDPFTLARIAPRIYNPISDQEFTAIELMGLVQGHIPEFDKELIDNLEVYIDEMKMLNELRDINLYYVDP